MIGKNEIHDLFGNPDEDHEFASSQCAYVLFYEQIENIKVEWDTKFDVLLKLKLVNEINFEK